MLFNLHEQMSCIFAFFHVVNRYVLVAGLYMQYFRWHLILYHVKFFFYMS